MSEAFLAIDIGGTQFRLAVVADGVITARVRRKTERGAGAEWMIHQLKEEGQALIRNASAPVRGCGIGFGGPVDFSAQRIVRSMHVEGWDDLPLPALLAEAFGVPSVADNDATVAAIGEHHYGAGKSSRNMVYYTVSTGVGGGIILDGKPYRGSLGLAGELGHVPLTVDDGPVCACGNVGCVEAYCSGLSIAKRAHAAGADPSATAKDVFDGAAHDTRMKLVVDETARFLGAAIAGVTCVLDPDCIVIGGGVSRAGSPFIRQVSEEAMRRMPSLRTEFPRILAASLGDDSVLFGAAALARGKEAEPHDRRR